MKNKLFSSNRSLLMAAAITLLVGAFSSSSLGQACDGTTDSQLVTSITARIKDDRSLAAQMSHINVVAINLAVKLQGWTNSQGDYDKVVGIVTDTKCVRVVNVNLFEPAAPDAASPLRGTRAGGCAAGTKACGDLCIPEGDACNIASGVKQ